MKTYLLSTTFVASLVVVLGLLVSDSQTQAQPGRPAPPQPGTRVAVIDMGYIFKNDPSFIQQMERLRNEVQAVDQKMGNDFRAIQNLKQKLKGFRRDSSEYGNLEAEIAKDEVDLKAKSRAERKRFVEKETQIRYDEYRKIRFYVKGFAERYGVSLVLRVSGDQTGSDKSVRARLALINRRVVFYGKQNFEITQHILDRIQENSPKGRIGRPGAGPGGSPNRTR